ncbi:MAG: hypothetical protein AAF747_10425, partial [Planctomycetota bacterium]
MQAPRSTTLRHLAVLVGISVVASYLGLTTHGLTNWQEAMRALVAREMHATQEWFLPTVHNTPYLAKPPMIYWAQLGLAKLTGTEPAIWQLRLTVALAGTASVILAYLAARSLASTPRGTGVPPVDAPTRDREEADNNHAARVAFWSAASLATGVLFVRSTRIGELDMLMVPFVIGAVWALAEAWRSGARTGKTHLRAIAAATACTACASLTKGPPALLAIAAGSYGAMLLSAAFSRDATQSATHRPAALAITSAVISVALIAPLIWLRASDVADLSTGVGLGLFCALAVGIAIAVARFITRPTRARTLLSAFMRTHPVLIIIAGLAPLWLWKQAVNARLDARSDIAAPEDFIATAAGNEAADNLRVLVLSSPLDNLEAASFGVGLGSVAAVVAIVWLIQDKPRLGTLGFVAIAWAVLGVALFSALGKGVGRYLTPVWPGIALLGGMWLAAGLRDLPWRRTLAIACSVAVAVLAVAQGAWYGLGRELRSPDRSPGALVRDLAQHTEPGFDHLIAIDMWHPAIDHAAGQLVEPYFLQGPETGFSFGRPEPASALVSRIQASGPVIALIRADRHPLLPEQTPRPIDALREAIPNVVATPIDSLPP